MSRLFLDSDQVTAGDLRAMVFAAVADAEELSPEELGEYVADHLDIEFGKRLDALEEKLDEIDAKLDKLMEHLGAGE